MGARFNNIMVSLWDVFSKFYFEKNKQRTKEKNMQNYPAFKEVMVVVCIIAFMFLMSLSF